MAGQEEAQVLINLSEAVPWWSNHRLRPYVCAVVRGKGNGPCQQDVYHRVHLGLEGPVVLVPFSYMGREVKRRVRRK